MYLTILSSILAVASAGLIGNYAAPTPFMPLNPERSENIDVFQPSGQPILASACGTGLMLGADGNCMQPEVTRELFLVEAPRLKLDARSRPGDLPKPKLHYNIVLVRTPEDPENEDPIVVPPPQHKTIVYVLNKDKVKEDAQLIHMQAPAHKPEIFFVNYKEGENPQLPIGIDLQTALGQVQTLEGQVVDAGQPESASGIVQNNVGSGVAGIIDQGVQRFDQSSLVGAGISSSLASANLFGRSDSGGNNRFNIGGDVGQPGSASGIIQNNFGSGVPGIIDQGVQRFDTSNLVGAGISSSLASANLFGRSDSGGNNRFNIGGDNINRQYTAPPIQPPSNLYGAP